MNKKACINHEGQAHIINTNNNIDLSPLEWWRLNGGKYWNLALFAQKWLSVMETSTPSKRVLLVCGLVDTSKRSNLLRVSIEKKVFRYKNINKFHSLQKYSISFHVNL